MAAHKIKEQINLLPEKGFESTTLGRVLAWILSTFRIIVMVTELIVMLAFMSRFWLDAQNSDLNDEMNQKKAILTASKDFENQFKDTQQRLTIFDNLTSSTKSTSDFLKSIVTFLPDDTNLSSVTYSNSAFEIVGQTINEQSIQQYIVNLKSTNNFNYVEISSIKTNFRDPSKLDFKISANTNKTQ